MVKVVLDAMGGDHAPDVVLRGAALAVEKGYVQTADIVFVGQAALISERLADMGLTDAGYSVVDAPEVVGCDESPVVAMKTKPKSSIAVGIGELRAGRGDAFVSAGSTGVVAATAHLGLGTLEGVRRPGIGVIIEGENGPFMVIDVGANPQPKPQHLQQYALMGAAYFRDTFGTEQPRVALMNIGSEAAKGNSLTREVAQLIEGTALNFIGNVEGVDLFHGRCDVVVCDGFVGNVVLKLSEGLAEYMIQVMKEAMVDAGADEALIRAVIGRIMPKLDYSTYGGALLLGSNGIVTICHGRSNANAICNAVRFAAKAVGAQVNDHMTAMVQAAATQTS